MTSPTESISARKYPLTEAKKATYRSFPHFTVLIFEVFTLVMVHKELGRGFTD
jgi:hypothetical protein